MSVFWLVALGGVIITTVGVILLLADVLDSFRVYLIIGGFSIFVGGLDSSATQEKSKVKDIFMNHLKNPIIKEKKLKCFLH